MGVLTHRRCRSVSGFRSVGVPGRRSDCVPSRQPVQVGRQSAGFEMQVAPRSDLRIAQEEYAADYDDDDPQWVAVHPAPVVQPMQNGGGDDSDPGDLIPLVPAGHREPDEVAGQAGPAGMSDRVGEEPPDEIEHEVQHRADQHSEH